MTALVALDRFNTAALLAGLGLAMLAGALAFQHIGGLAPCALCIEQRKAWGGVILLAALALFADARRRPKMAQALLALAGIAALIGAGVAGFHVGVEQKWWAGTAACGANFDGFGAGGVAAMRERLLAQPVVRCDEVAWSLLGLSMAGWNGLIALAASAGALYVAQRDARGRQNR